MNMSKEKNAAEEIFEELKKDGLNLVETLVARRESEKFFLEFKRAETSNYSGKRALFSSDHKNFAKAISGFGNSEGGVLIWGIDAPSDNEKGFNLQPIKGLKNFTALLESYIRLSTIPAHSSVKNIPIYTDEEADTGIAISFIPKSYARPHQFIVDGANVYYMRAGDSFLPTPHGILQGMFGHEPQPDVCMMYNVATSPEITEDGKIKTQIGVMAVNGSTGIAEDINGFVRVWGPGDNSPVGIEMTDQKNYTFQSAYGVELSYISNSGFRLGYQQRSQMIVLTIILKPPFTRDLFIQLSLGAKNQHIYQKEVLKTPQELKDIFDKYITGHNWDNFYETIWDAPVKR